MQDDLRYLVKLADWMAGQGFCQIEGLEDPDEWCLRKWQELCPEPNGDGYTPDALADAVVKQITARLRREAREAMREDAAKACAREKFVWEIVKADLATGDTKSADYNDTCDDCEAAIRALATDEQGEGV